MEKLISRKLDNDAGYLRIFSTELSASLGFIQTKLDCLGDTLSLLPSAAELEQLQHMTLDFSQLKSGYPSFVAPFCAWMHSNAHAFSKIKIQTHGPKYSHVRNWLVAIGLYDMIQGNIPRQSNAGTSMPLMIIMPGDNKAPDQISSTIMNLIDRSGLTMTEDAHHSTHSALSEMLENVVRHSNSTSPAFVCAQVHPTQRKFSVCIADVGIGITQSFLTGPYKLPAERMAQGDNALELAIEPHISSKYGMGHSGWGLFFASELCRDAHGTFSITSDNNSLFIYNGNQHLEPHLPWKGTIINILLSTDSRIDGAIVWGKLPPYDEDEFVGNFQDAPPALSRRYLLGLGTNRLFTRVSAKQMLDAFLLSLSTHEKVDISVSNVVVVTPSFADEFFCGLLRRLGQFEFHSRISISGATPYLKLMIETVLQNEIRRSNSK